MSRPVSAAQIVADLDELATAGAIDPVAVTMVREGLAAIAERVRAIRGTSAGGALVKRDDVLRIVDPAERS